MRVCRLQNKKKNSSSVSWSRNASQNQNLICDSFEISKWKKSPSVVAHNWKTVENSVKLNRIKLIEHKILYKKVPRNIFLRPIVSVAVASEECQFLNDFLKFTILVLNVNLHVRGPGSSCILEEVVNSLSRIDSVVPSFSNKFNIKCKVLRLNCRVMVWM